MGVFGKSRCFGLLRREKPLLLLSEIEESAGGFAVGLCHNTILQVY
jgi:hypothetical protein